MIRCTCCATPAVARVSQPGGLVTWLCRTHLDTALDHADDDETREPARVEWLRV